MQRNICQYVRSSSLTAWHHQVCQTHHCSLLSIKKDEWCQNHRRLQVAETISDDDRRGSHSTSHFKKCFQLLNFFSVSHVGKFLLKTSVQDVEPSSGEVADNNLWLSWAWRRNYCSSETCNKCEPVFGLSVLGYRRNKVEQRWRCCSLCRYTVKILFWGNKNTRIFIFRGLYTNKNIFCFCQ